jgi:hypothetical protein
VAALHEAHAVLRVAPERTMQHVAHPRTGRVGDGARAHVEGAAVGAAQDRLPFGVLAARTLSRDQLRAREDLRAVLLCVERIEHDEARVVHPAIRVDEAAPDRFDERRAHRMAAHVDAVRTRQQFAPSQMIVEEQADADQPCGTQVRHVRHDETQRPHDVGRRAQQGLALLERLAHEPELLVLEVAQPAVNQLGTGRRGVRGEIVLFAKQHGEPAPSRVTRDARAVDPAAHDEQIVPVLLSHLLSLKMKRTTKCSNSKFIEHKRKSKGSFLREDWRKACVNEQE